MRFPTRAIAIIVSLLLITPLLMAACLGSNAEPTPTRTPETTPADTSTPGPTATTEQPTATPTRPSQATPTPIVTLGFFLQVIGIDSESVVHTNTVIIKGVTSPDAVLSINGILVSIDAEGEFEVTVSLDPGTNLIEVIASDFEGNQESAVFAIISVPEV